MGEAVRGAGMTRAAAVHTCGTCRWWVARDLPLGECRVHAPRYTIPGTSIGRWLQTGDTEFCGDWTVKDEAPSEYAVRRGR